MRSTRVVAIVAMATALLASPASASPPTVRTPAQPSYTVSLSASRNVHAWNGHEDVTFTNTDSTSLGPRIWLRVWSNGVRWCANQAIFVTNVTGGTAGALTVGCTALPVDLPTQLAPGDSATIGMDVRIRVPKINDRFGFHGGLTYVGTALPTLAIHDGTGWHLDPFVDLGESFYSVVGSYDVSLTVPDGIDTPSTGAVVSRDRSVPGVVTRHIQATDVRDFEWAAGDLRERTRVDAQGTKVHVWSLPGTAPRRARAMLGVAIDSMKLYSKEIGRYPYPEVDVVLSAFTTFGGMEYPQIVFTNPHPGTVAHELGHQWFYGIVGDDQYHAPWLDEAFASYLQTLPTHEDFGCRTTPPRWPSPGARITNDMAYWAAHPNQYYVIYLHGACALEALDRRFGHQRFLSILHGYARDRWFGFSTTRGFTSAIESAAAVELPGWNVARFWQRWRIDPAA